MIVYLTRSPLPKVPSPLSVIVDVFVTSIDGDAVIETTVGSSIVFPSLSIPSSDVSVTLFVKPGLLAVASNVLLILPLSTAF